MIVLEIALLVLLHLAVVGGILAVIFGLSGNFILLGLALLVAWLSDFELLSWTLWFVLLVLALLGEAVEAVLGMLAARGFGATGWGMAGAFAGGLAGAVAGTAWIPLVGSLLGAVLGGFAGAYLVEMARGRTSEESLRAGVGAFLGRLGATAFKLIIAAIISWYVLKAGYGMVG